MYKLGPQRRSPQQQELRRIASFHWRGWRRTAVSLSLSRIADKLIATIIRLQYLSGNTYLEILHEAAYEAFQDDR